MSITGKTTTCDILTNTAFQTSGLSEVNLSSINITDDNGLDVSECFGITTNIIKVNGTNVTLTGDCDTSLEILITNGIKTQINCNYTSFEVQQDGVLLFTFPNGSTSDNIHPNCCTALGYDPEIGPNMYWICRAIPVIDPTNCDNYTPTNTTSNGWQVFEYVTGGTVTTVPSADCCYQYGFVDITVNGNIKCILEVINPCEGYTVIEPAPLSGPIPFRDPLGNTTILVPSTQCCTALGYNWAAQGNNFYCYQFSNEKPTVTITNDGCCEAI